MDFRGVYEHGVIRPTEPVSLPEGTEVSCQPIGGPQGLASQFWLRESVETLAERQGVRPIDSIESLHADWADDEPIEELLASIRASRA
jgi:predicted DNA-binding antitoxin AbrB/MazE fold protein